MNYRNTPCRDTKLSPSEIIFGRPLRDHLPSLPIHYRPREEWTLTRERRELALAQRYAKQEKLLNEHTKALPPLKQGDMVAIQNQHCPRPKKWDRTGLIVETLPHLQYRVRVHGSGRITLRNRQFLKKIVPLQSSPSIFQSLPAAGNHPPHGLGQDDDDQPTAYADPQPAVVLAPPQLERPDDVVAEEGEEMNGNASDYEGFLYDELDLHPMNPPIVQSIPVLVSPPFNSEDSDEPVLTGSEINAETVLRRSSRPVKPNRKFKDYIMN